VIPETSNHKDQGYLRTGQSKCYDVAGQTVDCIGSGQDAELQRGIIWPELRFVCKDELVHDQLTDLVWTRNANLSEYPMMWQEALDYIQEMNSEIRFGYSDWRLPNRRELRSLLCHQSKNPALPEGHPVNNVFLGWYWTSTSAAISPSHAWYIHMEGARMFYGGKDQSYLVWPVRGRPDDVLSATGQQHCYDSEGNIIPCQGTGQDAEYQYGYRWPEPRFRVKNAVVYDRLTNLCWNRSADLTGKPVSWPEALNAINALNHGSAYQDWRLPNINELETLVDCERAKPALANGAPFKNVQDVYWSSTTSAFEPDWGWALYLDKGAIGVGQKSGAHFYVWPVLDHTEGNA